MHTIDPQSWKQDLPAFREKTDEFYAGTLDKGAYKGFSGLYGSYAQKGGKASMLRLRMTAGRVTRDKLAFVAQAIRTYAVSRAHFTTCQSIQLHDLLPQALYPIMEQALDHGIVTMGGGGDFPRNTMCSPLSGVEVGEYFDVMPYAEAAGNYAMNFIKAEKMPRKLKICFSNSPANLPHATYRDLGFAARPDGKFDVYSAGGLGNNPKFGVKVAEGVAPDKILYYVQAMWQTFRAHGNYENRGKARTRYMQDVCGGPEGYARAYQEQGREPLETYSFDYVGNRKHFKASAFQPDADAPWVKKAVRALGTRHRVLRCDIPSLLQLLPEAVEAKDLPGMADVDSSLLYFCRKVAERHTVALSGECADEVFGGYPWFERSELLEADTFPWCPDLEFRRAVVKPELWESLQVEDYVQARYQQSLAEMPALPGEALWERRRREVGWLSLNWFMSTLLDRKDRMSMAAGLEVRVPFCDHHLVEYVWNIPWAMKAMNGQRKQVLRDAAEGLLPEELLRRPKSPYPKTHDPLYEQLVRARLLTILDDRDAPIHSLVDETALRAGLLSDAGDYGKPWFGQLMAGPQMLAYLIQINEWMSRYHLTV